ncbi:hypothetical protein ACHAWF_002368 [Thalassiosira exigua]
MKLYSCCGNIKSTYFSTSTGSTTALSCGTTTETHLPTSVSAKMSMTLASDGGRSKRGSERLISFI